MGRTGGRPAADEQPFSRPDTQKTVPENRLIVDEEEEEEYVESPRVNRKRSLEKRQRKKQYDDDDDDDYVPQPKEATVRRWKAPPPSRSRTKTTRAQIFQTPNPVEGVPVSFSVPLANLDLAVRRLSIRAGRRIEFHLKNIRPGTKAVKLLLTGLISQKGRPYPRDPKKEDDRHTYTPRPMPKVFEMEEWASGFSVIKEGPVADHVTVLKVEEQSFALAFLGEEGERPGQYRCLHNYYMEVQAQTQEDQLWRTVGGLDLSVFSNFKPDLISKIEIDIQKRGVPRRPDWVDFERVTTRSMAGMEDDSEEKENKRQKTSELEALRRVGTPLPAVPELDLLLT